MNVSIKIIDNYCNENSEWDALLPNHHHLKRNHLLAFENSKLDDINCYYLQVFTNNELIGVVYLQQFNFKHRHLNFNGNNKFLSKALKIALPRVVPIIVCGSLFRINFQGFYFNNSKHNYLVFEAIKQFKKQNLSCRSSAVIVKDCEEVFPGSNYNKKSYSFFDGDITMVIQRREQWLNFNDYLNDLNKKYLQRAKKIIAAFKTIRTKELSLNEIIENEGRIMDLYYNVIDKQIVRLGTININYFVELKRDLNNNFEFHAIYDHDIMIGFYTFIFYEKEMETHYIGLDYEANRKYQVYFNILFLATQKMIEMQFDSMELGRTAREAKSNLGALPKQIFNYIQVSNFIAKLTLNYFLKQFNEKENQSVINRSPLK